MRPDVGYVTSEAHKVMLLELARSMGHAAFLSTLRELVMSHDIHSHAGGLTIIFRDER